MLRRGFGVNKRGRISSGGIEIAHAQIAKEAGVDRRAVDSTAQSILRDDELRRIFRNIESVAFLRDVAPLMELSTLIIEPVDARVPGILGDVATIIAKHHISIRQAVSDDPYFTDEPKLTVITDDPLHPSVIAEIKQNPSVKSITVL